jgi:hypothetical protein
MNTNSNSKDAATMPPPKGKDEIADAIFASIDMPYLLKAHTINLVEIITPQPYSVFALCMLYENSQRN